jgi:hypothetical protein
MVAIIGTAINITGTEAIHLERQLFALLENFKNNRGPGYQPEAFEDVEYLYRTLKDIANREQFLRKELNIPGSIGKLLV